MNKTTYKLTESDLNACLFALSQFPKIPKSSSDIQQLINVNNLLSAKCKLENSEELSANELRILCTCIMFCNGVCRGDFDCDKETHQECMKYMFTLSKLETILCDPLFSDI